MSLEVLERMGLVEITWIRYEADILLNTQQDSEKVHRSVF